MARLSRLPKPRVPPRQSTTSSSSSAFDPVPPKPWTLSSKKQRRDDINPVEVTRKQGMPGTVSRGGKRDGISQHESQERNHISIRSSNGSSNGEDPDETPVQNRMPSPSDVSNVASFHYDSFPSSAEQSFIASTEYGVSTSDSAHSYDLYEMTHEEFVDMTREAEQFDHISSTDYNSSSDLGYTNQSSIQASTVDSAHSYNLYQIDDIEISKLVEDAAPEVLDIRLANHLGQSAYMKSQGQHDHRDLEPSDVQVESGMLDTSENLNTRSDLRGSAFHQDPNMQSAPRYPDLTGGAAHVGAMEQSGLMTPDPATPIPAALAAAVPMSEKRRGKLPVGANSSPGEGQNAQPSAPVDQDQSFDPWLVECDDETIPLLSPGDTIRAIKRFLGANQCSVNFDGTINLLNGLSRQPQWPRTTVQNLELLVKIVLPGHEVVDPIRHRRLLDIEISDAANPPSVLSKSNASDRAGSVTDKAGGHGRGGGGGGGGGSSGKKSGPTKIEQWWRRFERKEASDFVLPPGIADMLNRSAVENLSSFHQSALIAPSGSSGARATAPATPSKATRLQSRLAGSSAADATTPTSTADLLASRIKFISTSTQANVQEIILYVFFFFHLTALHTDRRLLDQDYQALLRDNGDGEAGEGNEGGAATVYNNIGPKTLPRMMPRHYDGLWNSFRARYPEFPMEKKEFADMIKQVREKGSQYLYFAARLGLGCMLYLQADMPPSQMWGASKGGDKTGASDRGFRKLEELGLPALCKDSGANNCVREMLQELMRGF